MLKSKQNLTVTNGLELQDDVVLEEKGKGRKFTSRFIEAGLVHYKDLGNVLITKETLDKFLKTMIGCPVIINHETITDENADDERVGVISDVWYDDNDGWYYCSGIIWDAQAIDLVKNQGWNVSCSYDFVSDNKAGTHNSLDYDMEFTDGEFLHLALVKDPRYERANIVINQKDVNNGGAGSGDFDHAGRPGLVGGSEEAGTGRKGKYEKGGVGHIRRTAEPAKKEETKPKTETETKRDKYIEGLKKYREIDREKFNYDEFEDKADYYKKLFDKGDRKKQAKKEITKLRKDYAESIMKNFESKENNPYADRVKEKKERFGNLAQKYEKESQRHSKAGTDMADMIPMGQPIHSRREIKDREKISQHFEKSTEAKDKSNYYREKAESYGKSGISSDDSNAIAKLAEKYNKLGSGESTERRRIIDRVIELNEKQYSTKPKSEKTEYGFEIHRNQDDNTLQLKFDEKPNYNTISLLKEYGFRYSPKNNAWQRQLNANSERSLRYVQEKLRKANNSMNSVINSLTEFIQDIVNNDRKENDMDKVDKRKLIDEVAGMLDDDGCSDEIIRTAIKKMEKIAYEGSERDKRDNKCDDERDNERKNRCDDERDNRRDHADDEKEDNCGRRNRKDNKCDDERDNERRNRRDNEEKTDKRKLIDEIGGIMKSAGCDDEDIRTVIKKAEEIAYTDSERSRDNKCKNEDEKDREEFEKEKRIADVKNSVDYAEIARRVVNNSSSYEYGTGYISKEDRLKLGENY